MDDSELRAALHEAAPQVRVPADLGSHRARILAEARARRRRGWRIWGASAAASIVLVGAGSVAMAGGGMETPWGWVADNVFSIDQLDGSACFQGFLVKWDGLAEDDPIVREAKSFVSSIDLESLDTTQAEASLREANAQATDGDGDVSPMTLSDAQIKQYALNQLIAEMLWDDLEAHGHKIWPGHEVSLASQTSDCR